MADAKKKPATIYTRNSFASRYATRAAEGFTPDGLPIGRSAYISGGCASLTADGRLIGGIVSESDAIRWVALGVLPKGVRHG